MAFNRLFKRADRQLYAENAASSNRKYAFKRFGHARTKDVFEISARYQCVNLLVLDIRPAAGRRSPCGPLRSPCGRAPRSPSRFGPCCGLVPSLLSQSGRAKIAAVPKPVFLYGTISSIILLTINQLATIAGRNVPSAIMFPINDGGATIITAITAAIFFKEKLTVRSVCGLILGIGSLIVINLF